MKADSVKVLVIMDGLGKPLEPKVSGVTKDNTKYLQYLAKNYPNGLLEASEEAVGLPVGQTGTSDVGHLTIGTGRVNYQPLVRINKAIASGEFDKNPAILASIQNAKKPGRAMHLLGIPTDGGVHGHIAHLLHLIELCAKHKLKKVYIHYFTDGRDAPQKSANKYLDIINSKIKECKCGEVINAVGRFYAMDRDNNWDRMQVAYDLMVNGKGRACTNLGQAIEEEYSEGRTDEFLLPLVKVGKDGKPVATINPGDSVISYDYRADRERQLAYVLSDSCTLDYAKKLGLTLVCMTNYDESLKGVLIAYDTLPNNNILSEVLSERGYKQLKVAETEKYAYVTFSFNDGRNDPFPNEDRKLIASVKMPLYSAKPEMSAKEIAAVTVKGIKSGKYDCIIINFANGDMVGHSGDLAAAKIAVGVVDECVKQVVEATLAAGGEAIVTADHGNSDIMQYPDGSPHTSHTINKVPVFVVGKKYKGKHTSLGGTLADIAPTYLKMLGEQIPQEMTGKSLI